MSIKFEYTKQTVSGPYFSFEKCFAYFDDIHKAYDWQSRVNWRNDIQQCTFRVVEIRPCSTGSETIS